MNKVKFFNAADSGIEDRVNDWLASMLNIKIHKMYLSQGNDFVARFWIWYEDED